MIFIDPIKDTKFEYSSLENLDNIWPRGMIRMVYQPLIYAKCIISQARQVIVGEDNDRNRQYTIVGKNLIEKCWSISTMNRPIICPIQSFMACRTFHGEIIWEIPRRNFSQVWTSISMISHRGFVDVTWLINLI